MRGCVPSNAKYSVNAAWVRVETHTIRCTISHLVMINTERGNEGPKSSDQVEQLKRVTVGKVSTRGRQGNDALNFGRTHPPYQSVEDE